LEKAQKIDYDQFFVFLFNQEEVQEFIIGLNQDQLYSGVNSAGIPLESIGGSYAPQYKAFKLRKAKKRFGQPNDEVNLFLTGDYYDTYMIVNVNEESFTIDSNPFKGKTNLEERYGNLLEGLTQESIEIFVEYLETELLPTVILEELGLE